MAVTHMRALPSLLMTQFSKLYQDLLSFFGALVRTEYAVLMRFLCFIFLMLSRVLIRDSIGSLFFLVYCPIFQKRIKYTSRAPKI